MARWLADTITQMAIDCVEKRDVFRVALSGGSTPRALYLALGADPCRQQLPWRKIEWFLGDERFVPAEHTDSNSRMVRESLLQTIPMSATKLFAVPTDAPTADEAAAAYETDMLRAFGLKSGNVPVFDLMLLGLGEDGHTASLFPGTDSVDEENRMVTWSTGGGLDRITCTFPCINAAKNVVILAAGERKATILKDILEGSVERYPVQRVHPDSGRLIWALDQDAAQQLETDES